MFTVNGNKITTTRGDTFRVKVGLELDGEIYVPVEGDHFRFAVKHETMNHDKSEYTDSEPLILKNIPWNTMILQLDPEDTKPLGFGRYDYDIRVVFGEDGTTSTFISDKFILTKEVD